MRIFVTGSSGYVGSALVLRLLKEGHQVNALVRSNSNYNFPQNPNFRPHYGDLESREVIQKALLESDAVVHAAALITSSNKNDFKRVNDEGTKTLVELCVQNKPELRHFVYISSQAAGGPSRSAAPRKEIDVDEPVTIYGASKLAGEKHMELASKSFPCTILRPSMVYGPGDRKIEKMKTMINLGIIPALGSADKLAKFSFISLHDLNDAILLCLNQKRAPGTERYFLAEEKPLSLFEYSQAIANCMGKNPLKLSIPDFLLFSLSRFLPEKIANFENLRFHNWTCSGTHIAKQLGFMPKFHFLEEIKRIV